MAISPVKPKHRPHAPRYAYDCYNCKFSWCCGYPCYCNYKRELPGPPKSVKRAVEKARVAHGLSADRKDWGEFNEEWKGE